MKKNYPIVFIVRWLFNSLGLWIAVSLLGSGYDNTMINESVAGFLFAGLIFSIVNSVLKPFIVILSLPAILLTLGLFMLVINGILVYISINMTSGITGISMSFINAILTGMILSLVNYIVSATIIIRDKENS